jgi:hypothetical protein
MRVNGVTKSRVELSDRDDGVDTTRKYYVRLTRLVTYR